MTRPLLPLAALVVTTLLTGGCRVESRSNGGDTLPPSTALPGAGEIVDRQTGPDTVRRDTLRDPVRRTLRDTLPDTLPDTVPDTLPRPRGQSRRPP